MRQGKYVFIIRQDGTYKHCRYQRWQQFLLGQCAISGATAITVSQQNFTLKNAVKLPESGRLTSIEIDTTAAGSHCKRVYSNYCVRESAVNDDGYCQSSALKTLSYNEFCSAFASLAPESNRISQASQSTVSQESSVGTPLVSATSSAVVLHDLVEDYIQQLLDAEQKTMPIEQYDAFGHADLVDIHQPQQSSRTIRLLPRRCA